MKVPNSGIWDLWICIGEYNDDVIDFFKKKH